MVRVEVLVGLHSLFLWVLSSPLPQVQSQSFDAFRRQGHIHLFEVGNNGPLEILEHGSLTGIVGDQGESRIRGVSRSGGDLSPGSLRRKFGLGNCRGIR